MRGNASEVMALAGTGSGGRGVDSTATADDALEAAVALAARTGGVVAVSGPVDVVTDGARVVRVGGGHPLLTRTTGAGCALGALAAAYVAATGDRLAGAVAAHAHVALAAEAAAAVCAGPRHLRRGLGGRAGRGDAGGPAARRRPGRVVRPALDPTLYLVTDTALSRPRTVPDVVRAAVAGGVTAVQVRDKHASRRELYELTLAVRAVLPPGVALFVERRRGRRPARRGGRRARRPGRPAARPRSAR